MKYAVKQRLISMGDDFDIRDEHGQKVFFVDGLAFSFADNLIIKDMARNEVARIKKKLFSFFPTYTITRKGQIIATIKKRPFTLRTRFNLDISGPASYEIVGNMFRYDYHVNRDGREVARVSKKILAFSDTYGVDIKDNEDPIIILGVAIIVDMVLHRGK